MTVRARLLILAFVVGAIGGGWKAIPVYAAAETCDGCCFITFECGSPFLWRCCLPKSGEAPCGPANCPNYCLEQTTCGRLPDDPLP